MKNIIIAIVFLMVGTVTLAQPNVAPIGDYVYFKKSLNTNSNRSDYSFWDFNTSDLDTLKTGDTLNFAVIVDMAKHEPVSPMLNLNLKDVSGTSDSISVKISYYVSQFGALASEVGEKTSSLYQDFHLVRTIDSTYDISSSTYKNIVMADSVSSDIGVPMSYYNHIRSAFYDVTIKPLGTTDTVLVYDLRFKCFLNPNPIAGGN